MRNQQQTIVIRRSGRKRGDDQPAGGAWKVAFADFTLAMMALFLILWILSASPQEERDSVAEALRGYSIFSGAPNPFELGKSLQPFDLEGYNSIIQSMAMEILTLGNQQTGTASGPTTASGGDGTTVNTIFESPFDSLESMPVLADLIREMGYQLKAFDNLAVDVVPQGLRIRLQDSDERQMFARGGASMNHFFEDMLLALAPVFGRINNSLVVSGHTDSVPFNRSEYGNWELSGDRALIARKILQAGGTPVDRIIQVAAMADRVPSKPEDPLSSANRRIEILVLTDKARAELQGLFDHQQPASEINRAKESALRNLPVTR